MIRMRSRSGPALLMALALGGCRSAPPPKATPKPPEPRDERFVPDWTAAIPLHIDALQACLADRQGPLAVAHLQELITGASGVTAVDGLGHLENCVATGSKVIMRKGSAFRPEDLRGLPLFSLGKDLPRVESGVVLEEVVANGAEGTVLGWLYWPTGPLDTSDTRPGGKR